MNKLKASAALSLPGSVSGDLLLDGRRPRNWIGRQQRRRRQQRASIFSQSLTTAETFTSSHGIGIHFDINDQCMAALSLQLFVKRATTQQLSQVNGAAATDC